MRHTKRGMEILRPYLPNNFCETAAKALYSLERGSILLTTGFYVAGFAETDGPSGTLFIAKALNSLGFDCTVVTDKFCRNFFDGDGINTEYADINAPLEYYNLLLDKYAPKALIALERCGINVKGNYANMRGENITNFTAKIDLMFDEGARRKIPTFGIGDGGNEIGMGNFKDIIERELDVIPCVTKVDFPIIATVSNWGGYGICAYLQMISGKHVMPSYNEAYQCLKKIVELGGIDGVTKKHEATVDGFSLDVEREIIDSLNRISAI